MCPGAGRPWAQEFAQVIVHGRDGRIRADYPWATRAALPAGRRLGAGRSSADVGRRVPGTGAAAPLRLSGWARLSMK
ncbi:hypothetical protein GCM10027072_76290 [Streptomyces bullii]